MSSESKKTWFFREQQPEIVQAFCDSAKISHTLACVIHARSIRTTEGLRQFLNPAMRDLHDDLLLCNMREAVARIYRAVSAHESILIFGDSDVDGITSASILYEMFENLRASAAVFIPRRLDDGHGFNQVTLENALKAHTPDLLIAVDCGLSGIDEIAWLKQKGIDTIVIDHHIQTKESLPDCIIVNPKLSPDFPYPHLAAVGVTFHVIHAVHQYYLSNNLYREHNFSPLKVSQLLDLVCLGTIADSVPLTGENRIFVKLGLNVLQKMKRSGVAALFHTIKIDPSVIDEKIISFKIAPRINSAGRMGDPNLCVKLLTTYRFFDAQQLAKRLEAINTLRQNAEADVLDHILKVAAAQAADDAPVIIVDNIACHQGILGILAGKLLDRFSRPAIVISKGDENARGSIRSPRHVDILESLRFCSDILDDFGGHSSAAGFSIKNEFVEKFKSIFVSHFDKHKDDIAPVARLLNIDTVCTLKQLKSWSDKNEIILAPLGPENQSPVFCVTDVVPLSIRFVKNLGELAKFAQNNCHLEIVIPSHLAQTIRRCFGSRISIVITPYRSVKKFSPAFVIKDIDTHGQVQ